MVTERLLGSEHDRALVAIDTSLEKLRLQTLTTDFKNENDRTLFLNVVLEVRKKYQTAETVITGKRVSNKKLSPVPKSLKRPINPKQMEAWILKLKLNITKYLSQDGNTPGKQLKFIKEQYPLLNITIKVLNGDAHFIGCQQVATSET